MLARFIGVVYVITYCCALAWYVYICPGMNRKTSTSQPRDARGRFLPSPKTPNLWLPDVRWIAPSAADRELARAVVAAADVQRAAIVAQHERELRIAYQVAVRATGPCVHDGTAPERSQVTWGLLSTLFVLVLILGAFALTHH